MLLISLGAPFPTPAAPVPPFCLCSPLVFDLSLAVDSASLATGGDTGGWKILHVYGSPMPNDTALSSDGTVMKVGRGRAAVHVGPAARRPK